MNRIDDTIAGVLVWAAVLEWATYSHQAEWDDLLPGVRDAVLLLRGDEGGGDCITVGMDGRAMFTGQTYLIGMALDHMAERLRWLEGQNAVPASVRTAVTDFLTLHRSQELDDLRDVLAHAHDYAVGQGRKPHLIVNRERDWRTGVRWHKDRHVSAMPGVFITDERGGARRVSAIWMFGKSYEVQAVIQAAMRVFHLLRT